MPTARELLEQADALMRRRQAAAEPRLAEHDSVAPTHRGAATDAVPRDDGALPSPERAEVPSQPQPPTGPLYAAHAPTEAAPTGGLRAAVGSAWKAPSPASVSSQAPFDAPAPAAGTVTTSPAFVPSVTRSPRPIQHEPIAPSLARTALPVEPGDVPVFTVPPAADGHPDEPSAEPDFPVLTDAVATGEFAELAGPDEVPLLTDAVDETAEEAILEDLDEPSVWSPTLGGTPSVSPRGPASIAPAVVPPGPVAGLDPLGLDRPPPGFQPAAGAQQLGPPVVLTEPELTVEPEAGEIVDLSMDRALIDEAAGIADGYEADRVEPALAQPWESAGAELAQAVASVAEPAPVTSADGGSAPAPGPALPMDDARVREIAEEIGMQVLQRIDIFTDTELRAQLGERLRPVVDRASADLVAAINQQVGELLRAFVAEAIEKEIDRWRDRNA